MFNFFRKRSCFEIYTDGSSKGAVGSWAFVISQKGKNLQEKSGRVRKVSCNRMEFQAAIEALSSIHEKSKITLFSDSRILIDAMKSGVGPEAYQDQIEILKALNQKHQIKWQWVKAHNGNSFNERCDELCILARG